MKKEITINLTQPISYAPKGGSKKVQSQALTIFCPTQREMASLNVIDTIYHKYNTNVQKLGFEIFRMDKLNPIELKEKQEEFKQAFKKSEEEKKEKFKISDMKAHITGKELTDCYGALQNILCGSAKLDENTCINTISYKELSLYDLEIILQEFIENFIIRSHQP